MKYNYETAKGEKATILHTLNIDGLARPVVVCIKTSEGIKIERLTIGLKYMVSAKYPYITKRKKK